MAKSSIEQYQEFQDYTNYIDTSDVMLGFYKGQSGTGLEKYYLMIEEWLNTAVNDQENKPLVIQADGGVGKKALLVKWFEYHQSLNTDKKKDLIILHFATTGGNNSNYFYAIYRILIKLREELNIGQKVELHEEKLRKYFSYWLDVCNQRIVNQSIHNLDITYDKIILVFEGIDYFLDRGTNKEGNIAFWLPKYFPKNVKVIVTADRQSESMKYFNSLGCQKVSIPSDPSIVKTMIKWQSQKKLCVESSIKDKLLKILEDNVRESQLTSLYIKSYLSCLLPERIDELQLTPESILKLQTLLQQIDLQKVKKLRRLDDLFDFVLDFWSKILFQQEDKFRELIGFLISTQKGLTLSEIITLTKMSTEQIKLFITIFRIFLMNFKDLWMIKNDSFKRSINKKYQFKFGEISQRIAQVLKRTPNSVRKLQEQTFQLYSAGNYFKLKEVISDIQNFLLLFNPYTKYDLCRYWQKLQEKSFDPVIQYNKAIQGFQMHYHPTSDDLFRIITQISRFLKQFADFQTYYTPEFRHPKLIGNTKQLSDIGILGQFKNLSLCEQQEEVSNPKETQDENSDDNNNNRQEIKLKRKLNQMYQKIDKGKHIKKANLELELKDKDKQVKEKKKQKQIPIQQLNVQVKSNQAKFREYYYQQIKPFLQKVSLEGEKEQYHLQTPGEDQCEDSDMEEKQNQNLMAKIKNIQMEKEKSKFQDLPDLKMLYAKTVQQDFQLNQKPPTNYYYKRWIWMQFPWVCMTMKCDYSDKLRKCFTSATSYMSVSQERQFTLQALKIALQAKKKKQAILQKSQNCNVSKVTQSLSKLNSLKVASTRNGSKLKQNQFNQLAFVTNSFLSLANLSKELQNINYVPNQHNQTKGQLFITAQDRSIADYSSFLHSNNKKKKKTIPTQQLNISTNTRQGMLPRIKQSVNNQMIKELQQLQKNNCQMRKQVDAYLYKNKVLAKKLKQLKIIQFNSMSQLKTAKKIDQMKIKISEIQSKLQKVKYQYAYSLLQHDRLNILIKICKKNKTHNEQTIPDLVTQCNNFRKMIKIQSQSIKDLRKKTQQIKKLTKKFVENCYQKIENQINLTQQIKLTLQNRQNFKEQVQKYDQMIIQQIQTKRKQLNDQMKKSRIKKEENSHYEKQKKTPEKQEDYQLMYYQLMQYLNIKDQIYKQDEKYIKLIEGLTKKRQFQSIIQQRKTQLQQLQKKYHQLRRQMQTLQKAKQDTPANELPANSNQLMDQMPFVGDVDQLHRQYQDKQRIYKKVSEVKLSCLGMLNTWYNRLGLPSQNQLIITNQFLQKLEQSKVLSQVQTC